MDTTTNMIFIHGKDNTTKLKSCSYNPQTKKYDVVFKSKATVYPYNVSSIEWLKNPRTVDPSMVRLSRHGRELFNIEAIYVFHGRSGSYWHILFSNGTRYSYAESDLQIAFSCLHDTKACDCLTYLRQIAGINELKSDEGVVLLQKQYEKLDFVGENTALAAYLNPQAFQTPIAKGPAPIFPFGGNKSQFRAVQSALNHQVSVLQGPPGTGKTQTILNIIANLLVQGKTVQVVSNNNSATANVLDKLERYGMGFLVAPLGKADNKKEFIQRQTGVYPDLVEWELEEPALRSLYRQIQEDSSTLSRLFEKQERLALAKQEMSDLQLEIRYFEQYRAETGQEEVSAKPRRMLAAERIMELWQESFAFAERRRALSFWYKFKSVFFYGISDWSFYRNDLSLIIAYLQGLYYGAKYRELTEEITSLERELQSQNANEKMDALTETSMKYFKGRLFQRFGGKAERTVFKEDDLWKTPQAVVQEYPVILSTTFSSRSSLGKELVYDYLIMDEASQVDVATGALALSCTNNAVIVGDTKQLPNVVSDNMKRRTEAIWESYQLDPGYAFVENSFLQSVCRVLPDAPQTLLREHYRCHPKIIGFCNQKFYNNELIVMTQDHGEPDVLSAYMTVVGSHRRDNMNQRQIDVIREEALPALQNQEAGEIGVIAPYNDQVHALREQLTDEQIDIATVHKFQGREKDTIILTTVDDVISEFADNPYLLNVAVSRAKKRLCLVTSGNEQPADTNIEDLLDYIRYQNFQSVQSELYSIFDYLYRQYTASRLVYLKRHKRVSDYDSENLMYGLIRDVLQESGRTELEVVIHMPLNMLIRDPHLLSEEEVRYVMNTATHLDFLIYNRIAKKPVLAVEVDGFRYHKKGTPQAERDQKKDHILELYHIPLLRFPTNGSGEREKLRRALSEDRAPATV